MEVSPGLIIYGVFFLVLVFGGALVAMMISWRRAKSKEQPEPEHAEDRPQPQRAPVAPVQRAAEPLAPANDAPPHPDEMMRVVYDDQEGRVLVEVGGKRYAHIREIKDADVGKRVLWAIVDLIRFTGGMAANPQAVRGVIGTQPPPMPRPTPRSTAPSPAVDVQQAAPLQAAQPASAPKPTPLTPPPAPVPEAQPDRERYSMVGFFRRGLERPPSTPEPSASSFINEIEEILQQHIQELPTPLPLPVHVLTGPDGTLQIEVGLNKYGSPNEVPDPEIRQLIKEAVAEWERR